MISNSLVKQLQFCVDNDKAGDNLFAFHAYLSEEVGEVAANLVIEGGLKDKPIPKEKTKIECIDVIITALGLYLKLGGTIEEFEEIFKIKLHKWYKRACVNSNFKGADGVRGSNG